MKMPQRTRLLREWREDFYTTLLRVSQAMAMGHDKKAALLVRNAEKRLSGRTDVEMYLHTLRLLEQALESPGREEIHIACGQPLMVCACPRPVVDVTVRPR